MCDASSSVDNDPKCGTRRFAHIIIHHYHYAPVKQTNKSAVRWHRHTHQPNGSKCIGTPGYRETFGYFDSPHISSEFSEGWLKLFFSYQKNKRNWEGSESSEMSRNRYGCICVCVIAVIAMSLWCAYTTAYTLSPIICVHRGNWEALHVHGSIVWRKREEKETFWYTCVLSVCQQATTPFLFSLLFSLSGWPFFLHLDHSCCIFIGWLIGPIEFTSAVCGTSRHCNHQNSFYETRNTG